MNMSTKAMILAVIMVVAAATIVALPSDDTDAASDVTIENAYFTTETVPIVGETVLLNIQFSDAPTSVTGVNVIDSATGEPIWTDLAFRADGNSLLAANVDRELEEGTFTIEAIVDGTSVQWPAAQPGPEPGDETYTITIDQPDNGTISVVDADGNAVADGAEVPAGTLTATVTAATGYKVVGEATWTVDVTADTTISLPADTTIEADTTEPGTEGYIVTYYDGDVVIGTQAVPYDNQGFTADVTAPAKNGMTFVRWNTDNGRAYNFETPVTGDLALYAMYELNPTSEMTVSGDSNTGTTVFDYNQIVTVNGTWTLVSGASITIMGQLVVPEGSTLVIEPGAVLILAGVDGSEMGPVADIQGTVVIENDGESLDGDTDYGALSLLSGEMSVSGSIEVEGAFMALGGTVTIETNAGLTIADNGGFTASEDTQVDIYGTMTVNGLLVTEGVTIADYGTVVIDSTAVNEGEISIGIMAAGAVVDVQRYTTANGSLTVTDANLVFKAATSTSAAVTVTDANTVVLTVTDANEKCVAEFSGLYVTESVSQRTVNGVVRYTNTMDVSGDMGVYEIYNGDSTAPTTSAASAEIEITAGKAVSITGDVVLGEGVTVTNAAASGAMTVTGSVDATAVADSFVNKGTVTLSGEGIVTLKGNDYIDATVNGTRYVTGSGTSAVTTYVTVDAALATVNQDGNAIRTITVYGVQTVTVSATLPANVTMQLDSSSDLKVGKKNGSDVVLTVAEGADVRGSADITVNGTLYAEDKRDINSAVYIISDVYSEEVDSEGKAVRDGWARWTNIYTAMTEANPGDIVQINKDDGCVELTQNLTVPSGVTLVVPAGKAPLLLMDGVTMTVAGTLQTYEDVYAETQFGVSAMDVADDAAKHSSAIVVTGTVESFLGTDLSYGAGIADAGEGYAKLSDGAPIAGAYYVTAESSAISALDVAIANVADIIGPITVYGPVNAGDLTLTATEDCTELIVGSTVVKDMDGDEIYTVLTVSSLTVDGGKVTAQGEINGTIVIGEASLDVQKVTGIVVTDDADDGMTVTGNTGATAEKTSAVTLTAGTAVFAGSVGANVNVAVATGAVMVSEAAQFVDVNVNGTLEVAENSTVTATGTMTVNAGGVANVDANERATVATLVVYGEFNVAVATDTANSGTATAAHLDVGIDADAIKNGTAGTTGTVTGLVTVSGTADVSAQATVSAETQAELDQKVSTAFEVEGSVWFTNYAAQYSQVTLPGKAPVQNAYLAGWQDEDGNDVKAPYEADQDAVLTASIDYNVYHIYVLANEAVDDVFIDGNLMQYGVINASGPIAYYGYYAVVSAGSHTISCTLANGYSGNGVLSVNGTQMSGMTFTTEGTPATAAGIDYNLQLSGFEKSGYVPDSPDTTTEDDGGMSITDILLIVLVILIIVMAIIVAVRLMRS